MALRLFKIAIRIDPHPVLYSATTSAGVSIEPRPLARIRKKKIEKTKKKQKNLQLYAHLPHQPNKIPAVCVCVCIFIERLDQRMNRNIASK